MDCTLCGQDSTNGIIEETAAFCCRGCRTVWHLLSSRGQLEEYADHPIYLQAIKSGLISNLALKFESQDTPDKKRLLIEIREMWCPSCAEVIEVLLKLEKGILTTKVDYSTDLASIEYDPKKTSQEYIFSFVMSLGYAPMTLENILNKKGDRGLSLRFFVAAFCALNVMMFSYPLYASYFEYETEGWGPLLGWLSLVFSLPVICYSAWPIFKRFANSLKTGLYGMESLVVISTSSAFLLSSYNLYIGNTDVYFDTLTVIIALVLFGKIIESKTKLSAKEAFYGLARNLPQRVRREGKFVSIKEIMPGEVFEVLSGERIPLDGIVLKGSAVLNESSRTGEPLPVLKSVGEKVEAGGVVESGQLSITSVGGFSALEKIVEACMLNLEHKSQYIRVLDPIVRGFVPLVLFIALAAYLLTGDFVRSLSILLISCPCAIGIAAPLVESYLIRELAKKGAIVRNRGALFKLPDANLWVFDKTGTLTTGALQIYGLDSLSSLQKGLIKGLAENSCHVVSKALSQCIEEISLSFETTTEVQGQGIKGFINGQTYLLGSALFLNNNNYKVPQSLDNSSEVWFKDSNGAHRLVLQDTLRGDAKECVAKLVNVSLLSGDRCARVQEVAAELKIQNWKGELSPIEKRNYIKDLPKINTVVFVGDGLNDAPALTQADIGIATASSLGMAQAACDIILTTQSLLVLHHLKKLSQRAKQLVKQNLFWAFSYNLIGLALAVCGLLTPIFAAFAMTVSSLMVVVNSYRLNPFSYFLDGEHDSLPQDPK